MSDLLNSASLVMIPSGYKEDTVFSAIPTDGSGDLSFTRASNGTRVNSAGLVEVCPWNLEQYSEDLPNAIWAKASLTFNSTVTAPNGTSTAQNYSTAGAYAYAIQVVTVSSGEYYTASCYLKYTSGVGYISIAYADGPGVNYIRVTANLINGTIGSIEYGGNGANGTATITSVGDGWYRVTVSGTLTIGNAGLIVSNLALGATTFSIWGAQLNIGSTAKPYFPTTDRLNVPRLTYQNGGGGCPSLLLEKQSTNIVSYSEQFDNVAYTVATNNGSLTRTANYGFSPDGTQNADRLQMSITPATNNYSQLYQLLTVTSGQTYTWSVYIKSLSGTPTIGWAYDGSNWQNITVTTEWVRYTRTATATSININADFLLYHNIGTSSSADILVWGYQIEQSSYPTSYIPTTASSATRVADACSKTGISSLIGQTEGVVFADVNVNITGNAGSSAGISINDGTSSNVIAFGYYQNGRIQAASFVSGSLVVNIDLPSFGLTSGRHKFALAYKLNDYVFYVDGVQVGSDTSASVPATSVLLLSDIIGADIFYNQAVLFKTRLTNAELASLTTI